MTNNSWIKQVVSNFFTNNVDIFEEASTYHGFEENSRNKKLTESAPDGFKSKQLYGKILYKDKQGGIRRSAPIAIKLMPDAVISKFLSFSFANEINFYSKMIPALSTLDDSFGSLFPKFYHGEMMFNEKQNLSAIIFEDLKYRGYKMAKKKSYLDYQHLALMMRKLGQFHAYSYKAKNTKSHLFHPLANCFQETNPYFNGEFSNSNNLMQCLAYRGFELLKQDPKYEKYAFRLKEIIKNADDVYKHALSGDLKNPISVLTHCDYLRNNVMFRYTKDNIPDDMLIIDMATCRIASPVIDLVTVLYINADQATRDKYWDNLIDEYYSALKETFKENKIPSKEAIMLEFVGKSFYGYVVAAYFLPSLIADDNKIPNLADVDPEIARKFLEFKMEEIPEEMWIELFLSEGGEQGTRALKDILEDMIDRGFICT